LEFLDIFGDITYLLYFPHSSVAIVWVLCFALFLPMAFSFFYAWLNGFISPTMTIKIYFGMSLLSEDFNAWNRLVMVCMIAIFENIV